MPDTDRDSTPRYVFRDNDHALMVDRRGRRYLVRLRSSATFETHIGSVPHSELIGSEEGTWFTTSRGHNMLAMKPTMAEFSREMPRIATIIYPKDLGAILVYGDIFPGARILEAGSGSGALTIALLRAVGENGHVASYDVRQDMLDRTLANVGAMVPSHANLSLKLGDVYQGFDEHGLDRIILDLPEPWQVVPHASEKLVPGGLLLSFLPTVPQIEQLTRQLRAQGTFQLIETIEILMRPWSVSGRSVRPSHRMIGHTGFITTARKCSPRPSADGDDSTPEGEEE